jgi:hypothetical protein
MTVKETTRSPRSQRWDLLGRYQVHVGGMPFLDRLRIVQCPLFALLATRIHGPDNDRDPHNHSRSIISIALTGGYTERVWDTRDMAARPRTRYHYRWVPYLLRQHEAHTITMISEPLRTLVLAGRHHGTFHFWTPAGPVDYRDYG